MFQQTVKTKQVRARAPVKITELRCTDRRVSARVDGHEVWFESSNAPLVPAPEAFASAFLIPALEAGRGLYLDSPLDPAWIANAHRLASIVGRWWGYSPLVLECEAAEGPVRPETDRGTALCFTAGVDSFFTLLRGNHSVDWLIHVQGYDIGLDDDIRSGAVREALETVSTQRRCGVVEARTNLREHPLHARTDWIRSHGGALAALGHLCNPRFSRVLINSSSVYSYDIPFGTHWDTDPLWSSSLVEFVHEGANHWRVDKLRRVADDPLVQKNLQVCWEQLRPGYNCCRCEKCVRTMLTLHQCDRLEGFTVFPTDIPLARLIDELPCIEPFRRIVYERFLDEETSSPVRDALTRLLARSRGLRGRYNTFRRMLIRRRAWRR